MFQKSFTFTVATDERGHFYSAQPMSSPFSIDVKITATLHAPAGVTLQATFVFAPVGGGEVPPVAFSLSSGETVNLGKWKAVAGEEANVGTAMGVMEPPHAHIPIVVEFVASPSFF